MFWLTSTARSTAKKSLSSCLTASLMQKWALEQNVCMVKKFQARNYVYGPPQLSIGSYAYVYQEKKAGVLEKN